MMRSLVLAGLLLSSIFNCTTPFASLIDQVFINEFHYDNVGSDKNEFVEILAPATFDLSDFELALVNGQAGAIYHRVAGREFSQHVIDSAWSSYVFHHSGIQNGAHDGLALFNRSGDLIQFLSYEGVIVGQSGRLAGKTSEDVMVYETSATTRNTSIQLVGIGNKYSDFSWQAGGIASAGSVNEQQQLLPSKTDNTPTTAVSAPASLVLMCLALPWLLINCRRARVEQV